MMSVQTTLVALDQGQKARREQMDSDECLIEIRDQSPDSPVSAPE